MLAVESVAAASGTDENHEASVVAVDAPIATDGFLVEVVVVVVVVGVVVHAILCEIRLGDATSNTNSGSQKRLLLLLDLCRSGMSRESIVSM